MGLSNTVVLLTVFGLSNCWSGHKSWAGIEKPHGGENDAVYIMKYKAWMISKNSPHPPSTNYFLFHHNQSMSVHGIGLYPDGVIEKLSIIPMYITENSNGYLIGKNSFVPDIIGCCEYGSIEAGVRKYVINKEVDGMIEKYNVIAEYNESIIMKIDSIPINIDLNVNNIKINISISRLDVEYCHCMSMGYEDVGYLLNNDDVAYITSRGVIQELEPSELNYFIDLFSGLLPPPSRENDH